MTSAPDDVYKSGYSFDNLYALYKFDKKLRIVMFEYLLQAEAQLKTAVVYSFCNSHRACFAYRNKSSYTNPNDMLVPKTYRGDINRLYKNNIKYLFEVFDKKLDPQKVKKSYVKHYLEKHEDVPLWVLVNDLTFGNVRSLYQLLKQSDQNAVCKIISTTLQNYKHRKITPHKILRAFSVLVWARNICAHDDRLYCAESNNDSFATILSMLELVLGKKSVNKLKKAIVSLIINYANDIKIYDVEDLKNILGI